jgi:hypothetical protein
MASKIFRLNHGNAGRLRIIPTIMANDPSAHPVMAVLDTAIHALLFESRRRHES